MDRRGAPHVQNRVFHLSSNSSAILRLNVLFLIIYLKTILEVPNYVGQRYQRRRHRKGDVAVHGPHAAEQSPLDFGNTGGN